MEKINGKKSRSTSNMPNLARVAIEPFLTRALPRKVVAKPHVGARGGAVGRAVAPSLIEPEKKKEEWMDWLDELSGLIGWNFVGLMAGCMGCWVYGLVGWVKINQSINI